MSLDAYFRAFSYAMIACATLALTLAGGLPIALSLAFWVLLIFAWKLEGTKWQLSERTVLIVVVLSVPLFFLDWKYQQLSTEPGGRLGVTALAHLILFLSAIKLLQVKRDRDWVFLYLISFFEVLLAAGLSFSPVFLGTLTLYLLCALSTIIAFEIQKARRSLPPAETHLLVPPDSRIFKNAGRRSGKRSVEASRLPFVALGLLVLTFVLALPLFLVAPRTGAAALTRSNGSLTNFIGFSDSVTLGQIGELKGDDAVVMHVRIEDADPRPGFRWRGVALDEYTGRGWRKSAAARNPTQIKLERGRFQLGTTQPLHRMVTQTVFLEPFESPVLFAASKPIAVQGDFPFIRVDSEGSMQTRKNDLERAMYKVLSDVTEPNVATLRDDIRPYPFNFDRYLQVPIKLDSRINARANAIIANAHARNRYDEAKAIEAQLQEDYGYSLQMKASGPDPLSDFLFNVKTGHCEYFSTAMAVMLRTRGIATRVVNGFLPGEYNEAAGAYTVRQSDAHSWVEVYFPETQSWVTFDPTPPAGRTEPLNKGLLAQLAKYAEAFELIWFQYVVGYDRQEQRSLATSLQSQLFSYRHSLTQMAFRAQTTISRNYSTIAITFASAAAIILLLLGGQRVRRMGWRRGLSFARAELVKETSAVVFYERLIALLESRGIQRNPDLTPLEFASSVELPAAMTITRAYNRVRFGGESLSSIERKEIEEILGELDRVSGD